MTSFTKTLDANLKKQLYKQFPEYQINSLSKQHLALLDCNLLTDSCYISSKFLCTNLYCNENLKNYFKQTFNVQLIQNIPQLYHLRK